MEKNHQQNDDENVTCYGFGVVLRRFSPFSFSGSLPGPGDKKERKKERERDKKRRRGQVLCYFSSRV
jgi:hypothetical protein